MTTRAEVIRTEHTSFIGRDQEIGVVLSRFKENARLVTLVGPGGVGKTRLARAVAAELATGTFHVREVTLETITEARLVLPAIAAAFGISEALDAKQIPERVSDVIGDVPTLILLDNCEHLLEAARGVRALIDACANLSLLATSRQPLLLQPERLVLVDPLPLPGDSPDVTSAELWANPAVRLFVDRGRASGGTIGSADATVIAEIVRRLDGLPLAIELAAARLWQFRTPSILLEQLDPVLPVLNQGLRDTTPRHAAMGAAIAWSYDLLSPEEQQFFRRLSVCVGGFDLELARRLLHGRPAGGPYPHHDGYDEFWDVIEQYGGDMYVLQSEGCEYPLALELTAIPLDLEGGIKALVNQHLIYPVHATDGSRRFAMLETLRAFGQEELTASGEEPAARHAHATAMMAFSEMAGLHMWGAKASAIFATLDADSGNVRAAIAWADAQGAPGGEIVIRIVDPLWHYLQIRGMLGDARDWLATAVERPGLRPFAHVVGLGWLPLINWILGEDELAEVSVPIALEAVREIGYGVVEVRVLIGVAALAWRRNDLVEMSETADRALALSQAWGDRLGAGICLFLKGQQLRLTGCYDEARATLEAAYVGSAAISFNWGMATARYYASEVLRDLGRNQEAAGLLLEALERYWAQQDGWGTGSVVSAAASMAAPRHPRLAARLFGAAHTHLIRAGAFLPPTELLNYARADAQVKGVLGEATYNNDWTAGRALPPDDGVKLARGYFTSLVAGAELDEPLPATATESRRLSPITEEQRHVVRLLCQGMTRQEIGRELSLSYSGVTYRINGVKRAWGLKLDSDIVRIAILSGEFN